MARSPCRMPPTPIPLRPGPSRPSLQRTQPTGFIAMVMLVLLTLILGSLMVSARSSSGRLASAAQGRNREARDVAEAGLTEIVSELNKEANRKILVSGLALSSWSQGSNDSSNPLINPCTRYDSSGNAAPAVTPTAKAIGFQNGWQNLVSGNSSRSYRLVAVSYSDAARTSSFSSTPSQVSSGQVKSLIRLTVEGRVTDASGRLISSTRVVKEYEVVPKCCKRSFGRNSFAATNFGEDNRFCFSGGGAQTSSQAVAGVIGGINGGTISSSNNTINIINNALQPITRVLCRSDVPLPSTPNPACIGRTMTLGVISVVPSTFNVALPAWPGAASTPFTSLVAGSRTGVYVRVNTTTNSVEQCTSDGTTLSSCTTLTSCTSVSGLSNYVSGHYCRISGVDANKNFVTFDTSNSPLFLYFDTPTAPAPSNTNYISYQGNGTVRQVKCAAGSTGICATTAGIADAENLNIYAYGTGSMGLNGADAAVTMNIFAPNATFTIKGGGSAPYNFIGRLWLNNIYANGSTTMQVLESAPAQLVSQGVCTTQGCSGIGPTSDSSGTPDVDWVARSVTYSSAF